MKKYIPPVALLLMLAACSVPPPIQPRNDPYPAGQMHVNGSELRNDTAVGVPIATRDENGILVVTCPIRSTIDKTLYVDYRVTFFDAQGQAISTIGWLTKTLEANTPDRIVVNSLSARAADFQVDFRYAR